MSFDAHQYKIDQRQGWDNAASGWKYWWPIIEKGAQKINDRLIDLAKIKEGDQILDLATGIGEPAITAAKKITGSQGHVLAVDISPQMLSIARQRAYTSLVSQNIIEFKESDIESLNTQSSSFDAVLCRWGLMFLPNLQSTLKNVFNALKNGGRLAAAVWSLQSKVPVIGFPMRIVMRELNVSPSLNTSSPHQSSLRFPGPFSLADEQIIKDSLDKAGFKDIYIETQNVTFEFASINEYIQHLKDVAGPLKALLDNESASRQEEIRRVLAEEVKAKYANPSNGSVIMNNECICFVGTR
ncbi:MAG: class I SAM-dependent methyltransferase [Candidatus Nitrosocosmicus sp.]